ncbi:TetR/AcrR family transcriptional regulator [Pediococcus acidilactici]|uniref:TetR/AcrR family transcriptional regulator n=1 Tax=Pediococcus acidilactici TaxID=1254 RepID=UPI001F3CAAE4
MPKQTFFNLKDEKQRRIIAAARREFSHHPLYESSINNIIKEAKIPRGSFYQYFEDIADLYGYYFSLILEDIQARLIDEVRQNHGDIFAAVRKYAGVFFGRDPCGRTPRFLPEFLFGS